MMHPPKQNLALSQVAKLYVHRGSQYVRLTGAFRFKTREVFIRKDPSTGDVILSRRPDDWGDFLAAAEAADVPPEFLSTAERLSEAQRDTR